MTHIEAARREWPALEWVPDGSGFNGWANRRLVVRVWRLLDGAWMAILVDEKRACIRRSATAALRAARSAMPEHVEHVPRTPLAVARQDWPALRWREARAPGFVRLRGYDRSGYCVVAATRWDGDRWSVIGSHDDEAPIVWHNCVSLRDGLRRVRWALP